MYNRWVSKGRSVAVGVSDRWKVTCDIWHMTCDMWLVTHETWFFFLPKSAKKVIKKEKMQQKKAKKSPKVQNGVKKAGFHSIYATIRTLWESPCLPYAGFFLWVVLEPEVEDLVNVPGHPHRRRLGQLILEGEQGLVVSPGCKLDSYQVWPEHHHMESPIIKNQEKKDEQDDQDKKDKCDTRWISEKWWNAIKDEICQKRKCDKIKNKIK